MTRGMPAYAFSLPDTAGNLIKMQDFSGKVTLIDFMFHPCVGCAKLEPFLEKVHDYFKDNNKVAFIAISTDQNKEWREYQNSKYKCFVPGSVFLYTNGEGVKHPIIKYYDIIPFPTLILIDKEGKIITNRAPDPRNDNGEALIKLIKEHLN